MSEINREKLDRVKNRNTVFLNRVLTEEKSMTASQLLDCLQPEERCKCYWEEDGRTVNRINCLLHNKPQVKNFTGGGSGNDKDAQDMFYKQPQKEEVCVCKHAGIGTCNTCCPEQTQDQKITQLEAENKLMKGNLEFIGECSSSACLCHRIAREIVAKLKP